MKISLVSILFLQLLLTVVHVDARIKGIMQHQLDSKRRGKRKDDVNTTKLCGKGKGMKCDKINNMKGKGQKGKGQKGKGQKGKGASTNIYSYNSKTKEGKDESQDLKKNVLCDPGNQLLPIVGKNENIELPSNEGSDNTIQTTPEDPMDEDVELPPSIELNQEEDALFFFDFDEEDFLSLSPTKNPTTLSPSKAPSTKDLFIPTTTSSPTQAPFESLIIISNDF